MKSNTPGAKAPTTDGNDTEPQTDGGTRRRFLGAGAAAAALSVLPILGSAEGEEADETEQATESTEDHEAPRWNDVDGEGIYMSLSTEKYDDNGTYRVESYPDDPNAQISIDFAGEHGNFSTCLTEEEAVEFGQHVLTAAKEGK